MNYTCDVCNKSCATQRGLKIHQTKLHVKHEKETKIEKLTLGNVTISAREDGYVNATQLCQAGGKRFNDWIRLSQTQALIKAKEEENTTDIVIDIIRGNNKVVTQGTWIHPDLTIQLAMWISPVFSLRVGQWMRELLITGSVTLNKETNLQNLLYKKNIEYDKLFKIHNDMSRRRKRENIKVGMCFYILSNKEYPRDCYNIGYSKDMKNRFSAHNSSHIENFDIKAIYYTTYASMVEKEILELYNENRIESNKEFIKADLSDLKESVEKIIGYFEGVKRVLN